MDSTQINWHELARDIKNWAQELGFAELGITDVDMGQHEEALKDWLAKGYHGEMSYMADHGSKRYRPAELVPGTLRILSVRMNYFPNGDQSLNVLANDQKAYISRYALGRDYHKLMRKRLTQLGKRIEQAIVSLQPNIAYRAFVDSAPVLERGMAQKAGLGWIGKNAMLINPKAGSYFFLGELFTNLPLPIDEPYDDMNCGSCSQCFPACPTDAIVDNQVVDARKCISYLTIELKGSIPEELRSKMGNRIFGCDDCQLVCPWNKFTQTTQETDFTPRHHLDDSDLLTLFNWSEQTFLQNTEGMPIRRTGYERWLRNIAVALGNAKYSEKIIEQLEQRLNHPSQMVVEHVQWGLQQQYQKRELSLRPLI